MSLALSPAIAIPLAPNVASGSFSKKLRSLTGPASDGKLPDMLDKQPMARHCFATKTPGVPGN
jgi:hypothetical protein